MSLSLGALQQSEPAAEEDPSAFIWFHSEHLNIFLFGVRSQVQVLVSLLGVNTMRSVNPGAVCGDLNLNTHSATKGRLKNSPQTKKLPKPTSKMH